MCVECIEFFGVMCQRERKTNITQGSRIDSKLTGSCVQDLKADRFMFTVACKKTVRLGNLPYEMATFKMA